MTKYEGAIDEFDKYLIPVTPDDKAWQESIKTALALSCWRSKIQNCSSA
jgi:hypothetical protein